MVCMECGTRQPVAASCSSCSTSMALYYCSICHLFDDDPGRDIYHCPFCNFCRQVGRRGECCARARQGMPSRRALWPVTAGWLGATGC